MVKNITDMISIPDLKSAKNILILRSEGSLGDTVLTSCYYKKANPNLKISVVCFGAAYAYLRKIKYIDKIYRLPVRRVLRPNQKWLTLMFFGLKLGLKRFDFILDDNPKPQKNWYFFRAFLGEERIFDSSVLKETPVISQQRTKMMLDAMGLKNASINYDIPLEEQCEKRLKNFLAEKSIKTYIAFNVFSSVLHRSLSADNIAFIAECIKKYAPETNVILPVMPSMKEELKQRLTGGALDFTVYETHTIFDLFSLLNSSCFVISPDTAAVHIATGFVKAGIFLYPKGITFCAAENPAAAVIKSPDEDINNFDRGEFSEKFKEMRIKYL